MINHFKKIFAILKYLPHILTKLIPIFMQPVRVQLGLLIPIIKEVEELDYDSSLLELLSLMSKD
jgi:hypothetical protein